MIIDHAKRLRAKHRAQCFIDACFFTLLLASLLTLSLLIA